MLVRATELRARAARVGTTDERVTRADHRRGIQASVDAAEQVVSPKKVDRLDVF